MLKSKINSILKLDKCKIINKLIFFSIFKSIFLLMVKKTEYNSNDTNPVDIFDPY